MRNWKPFNKGVFTFFSRLTQNFTNRRKQMKNVCAYTYCCIKKKKSMNSTLSFLLIFFLLFCILTFYSSLEEDFTAATCNYPVMTSRCLISTHQTHFGRPRRTRWYTSQWRAREEQSKAKVMNISNHTGHNAKLN